LPIEYHEMARLEAMDAFDWYWVRSPAAAERFQRELGIAQLAIQDFPEAWSPYLCGTRHYLLKRFSYHVIYRRIETRIQIVAVAHTRREPGYWTERVEDLNPNA
jgi:toxin ParE1/3/4